MANRIPNRDRRRSGWRWGSFFAGCFLAWQLGFLPAAAQPALRKLGELDLRLVGLNATVDPLNPVVPKNVSFGVGVVLRAGNTELSGGDLYQLLGFQPFRIEAEFAGPGLPETLLVNEQVTAPTEGPLLLRLPAVPVAGDYLLSNVRLVRDQQGGGQQTLLDVMPRQVPVRVIDQVLITSVQTRPLSLDEIREKGIALDRDDYLGFQFTLGMQLDSQVVKLDLPVVFDNKGVSVPVPLTPPDTLTFQGTPIDLPTLVPVMLALPPGSGPNRPKPTVDGDNGPEEIRIPSLVVIPGSVGYLKQMFSAQLLVANGAPVGSNLTLREVTGKIVLPVGADTLPNTEDDPLSLADLVTGPQSPTAHVRHAGLDGAPNTPDDRDTLVPGEQGQAEFLLVGEKEGFHTFSIDIGATLDGLATGPVTLEGKASSGVLVRNPYFDLSFVVPSVVRQREQFRVFVTVTNIGQGIANDVSVTLDESRMSHARLLGDATQRIVTLMSGDSKTLEFLFESQRTGQVTTTYLHLEPSAPHSSSLSFTLGVDERGVPLSPDTLALPVVTEKLPKDVVETAMRVLGQAWSNTNAPSGTLPAGVMRISKGTVTRRAQALAEAGLRMTLGQPKQQALRDLTLDIFGGATFDAAFDQLLRKTVAGRDLALALGEELGSSTSASDLGQDVAAAIAGTRPMAVVAVDAGPSVVTAALVAGDNTTRTIDDRAPPRPQADIPGAFWMPLGDALDASSIALLSNFTATPYTLELTGRGSGSADLLLAYPHTDGTIRQLAIPGLAVTALWKGRISMPSATSSVTLTLEEDRDGDGLFETRTLLTPTTLTPPQPKLLSATVVGPETLTGAGPFGFHVALLFDHPVDADIAAQRERYSIPDNAVRGASRQLSGRLVFASLAQPEGPYVPTTLSVNGMRGVHGTPAIDRTVTLQSRLIDPGAVVTGRVLAADGTPVPLATVVLEEYSGWEDCFVVEPVGMSSVLTGVDGRFEFRYVRQHHCGLPFKVLTTEPVTKAVQEATAYVRGQGERMVLDLVLFGRGSVTGTVTDFSGNPVPGAGVLAISQTDPQVGGSTTADGEGRYVIPNITVGGVSVVAGIRDSIGRAFGRIDRAGTTATVNVRIESGSAQVSGTVRRLTNGELTPVGGAVVTYSVRPDVTGSYRVVAAAYTAVDGSYKFTGLTSGAYIIEVRTGREYASLTGTINPGQVVDNANVVVEGQSIATVRGTVRMPDQSVAAGAIVMLDDRWAITDTSGAYELTVLAATHTRTIHAHTRDSLRQASRSLIANVDVNGIDLTLSEIGSADFRVVDADGNAVRGQDVYVSQGAAGACGLLLAKQTTDDGGWVRFQNLPIGRIAAKALRGTTGGLDLAEGDLLVRADGVTASTVIRFRGTGTVFGVVKDPDGIVIRDALVELTSNKYKKESCSFWPEVTHRVMTDSQGRYQFSGVNLGPVSVAATHLIYQTRVGKKGALAVNGSSVNLPLQLVNTTAGDVSGTVFLTDGKTAAGAGIEVSANGPIPDVTVRTNAEGRYQFPRIFPQGYYTVTARDPVTGGVSEASVYLATGQNVSRDLTLKGRGTVIVRVLTANGAPVTSGFVRLQEEDFPRSRYDATFNASNDGTVTFSRVIQGPFTVEVTDAFGRGGRGGGKILVDGEEVTVRIGVTVTGTVTGIFRMPDGTGIPNGRVRLLQDGLPVGNATTDSGGELGRFKFEYVPAGDVRVDAQDPFTGRSGFATGRVADEGHLLTLNVTAQTVGTVTGIVTSNNVPQPRAHVVVRSGTFEAEATTDGAGRYVVVGVPEGRVTVTASLDNGFLIASATGTLATENQELTIDVALKETGVITGRVLEADGVTTGPISIVTVRPLFSYTDLYRFTTGENGVYRFDRVPVGPIEIEANVVGSTDLAKRTITVVGSQTNDFDLVLNGVGILTGRTLDSNNQPVAANVMVRGTGEYRYSAQLSTGADGSFMLPEVLAGPIQISIDAEIGGVTLRGQAAGTVTGKQTTNIDVKLQDTGTVTGIVRRADGVAAASGADVTIRIAGRTDRAYAQVQSDGTFTAVGVPLGQLSIYVADTFFAGYAESLGHALAANGDIEDIGTLTLDEGPVRVLATVPVHDATGVSQSGPVTVTFSHPLLDTVGIYVTDGGGAAVGLSARLSADKRTVTLEGALPIGDVLIIADTNVTDMFLRHPVDVFTAHFVAGDTTRPEPISVTPVSGTYQVPVTTSIVATYDEPISSEGLSNIVRLFNPNGVRVEGQTSLVGAVVTFVPNAELQQNARYTYTIYGAKDAAGNQQLLPWTGEFFTIDTVGPTLTLVQPANGTSFVPRPQYRVGISDPISGVDWDTAELWIDGNRVPAVRSLNALIYTEQISLSPGTHTVFATAKDRAGNVGTLSTSFEVVLTPATIRLTYATFNGTPVTNASVALRTNGGGYQSKYVDASGQATFTNVPPGPFQVDVYPSNCCRNGSSMEGVVSETDMGQTVDVIVRASPENVALRVRVFAADGVTPVPDVYLYVPGMWLGEGETIRTDANGTFERAYSPMGGQVDVTASWSIYGSDRTLSGHGSGFASADGESVTVDITMPVSVVRGSVKYATGDPVESWTVTAVQTIGARTSTYTGSRPAGGAPESYVLFGPLPGAFTVTAQDLNSTLVGTANAGVGDIATPVTADVTLQPFGRVTGIVSDTANVPVANADVALVAGPAGATRYANTDSEGRYVVEQVPLGSFSVMASFEGSLRATATSTLQTSGETATLDIAFGPTATVRGVLRTAANVPVPYETVYATINGIADAAYAYTDQDGVYELRYVPLGTISVAAGYNPTARGTATLQTADEIVTLDLTLPATGVVTGTVVTSAGQPAAYRQLTITSDGARQPNYTSTDSQGLYRFNAVPVGPFSLALYGVDNETVEQHVTGSIGAANEEVTINLALQPAGVVTGVVRDRSGTIVPNADVRVTAGNGTFRTNADHTGRYRVEQVRVGPVTANVEIEYWNASGTASGTLEGPSQPLTLDVVISGTTRLTGAVRDDLGDLATSFYIWLDSPGLTQRIYEYDREPGKYEYQMVPAGPFTLTAVDRTFGLTTTYTGVASAEGGAMTVDLTFTSGSVTGTVYEADGVTPAAGALVHFIDSHSLYELRRVTVVANAAGVYELPRMPAGTFILRAYSSNGAAAASATAVITSGGTATVDFTLAPR